MKYIYFAKSILQNLSLFFCRLFSSLYLPVIIPLSSRKDTGGKKGCCERYFDKNAGLFLHVCKIFCNFAG